MAVDGCVKPVGLKNNDSDSDDEKPLSFKRSNPKPKPTPPKPSIPNSNNQKGKSIASTSKSDKSQSQNQSNSSLKRTHTVKTESGDEKPLSKRPLISNNESKKPVQTTGTSKSVPVKKEDSDSEDEKPLSSRFSPPNPSKTLNSPSEPSKTLNPPSQPSKTLKPDSDDSDDEKPLSFKFPTNNKTLNNNNNNNISNSNNNTTNKTLNKRPLTTPSPSSIKKAKTETGSVKKSTTTASSSKKTSSSKKINKKIKGKNKKKNNKLAKSMKVPPGSGDGKKWTTLEHNGVIFPPAYKPHGVKMLYNGQTVDLTPEQEEVATMFAVMIDTDYAKKPQFRENFFNDWKKILGKNHVIKKLDLCDFTPIYEWHNREKEKKKQMTAEEKKAIKEEKMKQEEKYMWAVVDGVKEKVGNFRVEPPGLFRGRGEHPKMGKLKRRIKPSDITINIGKGAPIPECPIPGQKWREVRHDNTVTWLAYWMDPINSREYKYVFLAASSALKGQSDKEKYEKARLLKEYIHNIRVNYTRDFTSKDATKRQIAVATYLIDKLALRAGNEKDDDEADTVGCCTLRVENVTCEPPNKLKFDFLGKDSIRYENTVEVELPVYKAIEDFSKSKRSDGKRKGKSDDLFDLLDTSKLNAHLKELMPGLSAKVFRTYNASITLDDILSRETKDGTVPEKVATYQHANKEVAIICNHQRAVSKSHDSQMTKLSEKIDELKEQREELETDLNRAKKGKPPLKDKDGKQKRNLAPEAIEKKISQMDARIEKMELDKKVKEAMKNIALGTSKINYLDPRISVAWCKRHEVPIEKIFNKSLLAKFAWSLDVEPDYRF
ncbi:hypothetical protein LUZ60_015338 [Juncus effusus]|nr:hypothetical protein LUZ60_015338 [Juncus effusus]